MEMWKDIKGYEGLYMISTVGRVKSLIYNKEKILKPGADSCGYLQVGLCKDGNKVYYLVHRLVAQAFIANPENLPEVNHKDETRKNNVENLEWCSHIYNSNYGTRVQRIAESHKKQVLQYTLEGALINIFDSAKTAAEKIGLYRTSISKCCSGVYNSAGGFVWKFA
jgi:hypothetical protein